VQFNLSFVVNISLSAYDTASISVRAIRPTLAQGLGGLTQRHKTKVPSHNVTIALCTDVAVKGKFQLFLSLQSPVVTICTARFNIKKFYVLPTQCVYVFYVDLRTNSDYFPIQH
jgi:hypothetical protein